MDEKTAVRLGAPLHQVTEEVLSDEELRGEIAMAYPHLSPLEGARALLAEKKREAQPRPRAWWVRRTSGMVDYISAEKSEKVLGPNARCQVCEGGEEPVWCRHCWGRRLNESVDQRLARAVNDTDDRRLLSLCGVSGLEQVRAGLTQLGAQLTNLTRRFEALSNRLEDLERADDGEVRVKVKTFGMPPRDKRVRFALTPGYQGYPNPSGSVTFATPEEHAAWLAEGRTDW
jgi:hypothetical protein